MKTIFDSICLLAYLPLINYLWFYIDCFLIQLFRFLVVSNLSKIQNNIQLTEITIKKKYNNYSSSIATICVRPYFKNNAEISLI